VKRKINIDIRASHLRAIGQVDQKFILCLANESQLLIVDQHAADERIQLEILEKDFLCVPISSLCLVVPLNLDFNEAEKLAVCKWSTELRSWGLEFDFKCHLISAPSLFHERVKMYPKNFKILVVEHIRHLEEGNLNALIPKGYQDLLNSIACRSAIMFGTSLSLNECQRLLDSLKKCRFPYQCGEHIFV
jgi:DNA mismatch repair protein MLH3